MSIQHINSASVLDTASSMSFATLRWKYGTGIDTSTGNGYYKKVSYRHGVMTELGDIEESIWYQLMEQLIEKSGEQWLLDALVQWEKEHNYTRATPATIQKKALQLHSARIFDNPQWVCFLPFNRRFRPDALDGAHIMTVVNQCCGLPGEVTQEQIDRSYDDTIYCPHCGRWSRFSICPASGEEG